MKPQRTQSIHVQKKPSVYSLCSVNRKRFSESFISYFFFVLFVVTLILCALCGGIFLWFCFDNTVWKYGGSVPMWLQVYGGSEGTC